VDMLWISDWLEMAETGTGNSEWVNVFVKAHHRKEGQARLQGTGILRGFQSDAAGELTTNSHD